MTTFEEEIAQQPEALEKTLDYYINQSQLLQEAREIFHVNGINRILFTGMGSSLFSCVISQNFIAKRGYEVDVRDTGELLYNQLPQKYPPTTLVVIVSQSGESGEVVKLLEKFQKMRDAPVVWGITNNEESMLGQTASKVFKTIAGSESSVTSKTYVSTLLLQFLLGSALVSPVLDLPALQAVVKPVIDKARDILVGSKALADQLLKHLGTNFPAIYYIGRGCSVATIGQASLNHQEICRMPAIGITTSQFRHGPIEVVDKNFRGIVFESNRETSSNTQELVENISKKWGNGKVAVIGNSPPPLGQDPNLLYVPQPISNEYLAPIGEILSVQAFMISLAKARGIQKPGEFRNTTKITKDA